MQKPSRDSNYIEHIGSYQTGAKESVTINDCDCLVESYVYVRTYISLCVSTNVSYLHISDV